MRDLQLDVTTGSSVPQFAGGQQETMIEHSSYSDGDWTHCTSLADLVDRLLKAIRALVFPNERTKAT